MSVYTTISRPELEEFLRRYAVGELLYFEGISDGIENTNYFVTTGEGHYVLTIFEEIPRAELPFFLDLMAFLAEHGIPSAHPIGDRSGSYLQTLRGKPAALVQWLSGKSTTIPTAAQCAAIGTILGRMHQLTPKFRPYRRNARGAAWRHHTAAAVMPLLDRESRALLAEEIALADARILAPLPQGVIHADLFRDNALFEGVDLTGLIDFYYAFCGAFIYDVAVTVVDWCFVPGHRFEFNGIRALTTAYRAERAVSAAEVDCWIAALRAAGLRFWLSRLKDRLFPKPGAITQIKDPEPFKQVILDSQRQQEALRAIWR